MVCLLGGVLLLSVCPEHSQKKSLCLLPTELHTTISVQQTDKTIGQTFHSTSVESVRSQSIWTQTQTTHKHTQVTKLTSLILTQKGHKQESKVIQLKRSNGGKNKKL